jgi:hypothetical protein
MVTSLEKLPFQTSFYISLASPVYHNLRNCFITTNQALSGRKNHKATMIRKNTTKDEKPIATAGYCSPSLPLRVLIRSLRSRY